MRKLMKVLKFAFTDRHTLGYLGYALLVLGVLFALSLAAFYPLMREAKLVVTDTLPGLVYGAEVNSVIDDNFVRLLLMTDSRSTNEIQTLVTQIERDTQNNETIIRKYQESIFNDEDRKNCEAFVTARQNYIALRRQFMEHLLTDSGAASAQLKSALLPAYQKYRDAGRDLIKYNAQIGAERSARITKYAVNAIIFTLVAPVLIILFGIVLGIRIFKL